MKGGLRVGLAGFAATAVAYGPARTGYGLFAPDFREEFGLSTGTVGVIGSGIQAGFLLALLATALLVARLGPRLLVAAGGVSATVGMLLVAFSPNAATLAAGVLVAGMAAGFCWSPYNDLAQRTVRAHSRARVLSVVSTGTTLGIAASGLVALAAVAGGLPWRAAWLVFVVGAVLCAVLNALLLPRMPDGATTRESGAVPGRRPSVGWLSRVGSAPLFVVASSFGAVNAFYWSFNADLVSSAGAPLPNAGPVLYAALGVAGFTGLLTGDLVDRVGLGPTLKLTLLCLGAGAGLLGVAPGSLAVVGASAVLYGAGVMLMSALLSVWSSAVFDERPSEGFTAALIFFGVGGVVGPAALGALGGAFGLGTAFVAAAALILLNLPVTAPKARPAEDSR
ncbi:MFS transporter [Rubrobacter marinus]|uniref:MFS transporter n=1 Tax=Rubrobacter marinus TaxID=2653852 RepID=A0A6G8Q073_9ACTN|nr:MFS transporter [Rubrobacter marinus]QIN79879.1 MFS transporter [Rubrobacter marinus]